MFWQLSVLSVLQPSVLTVLCVIRADSYVCWQLSVLLWWQLAVLTVVDSILYSQFSLLYVMTAICIDSLLHWQLICVINIDSFYLTEMFAKKRNFLTIEGTNRKSSSILEKIVGIYFQSNFTNMIPRNGAGMRWSQGWE